MTIGTGRWFCITIVPATAMDTKMKAVECILMASSTRLRHVCTINGRLWVLGRQDRGHITIDGVAGFAGSCADLSMDALVECSMSILVKFLSR